MQVRYIMNHVGSVRGDASHRCDFPSVRLRAARAAECVKVMMIQCARAGADNDAVRATRARDADTTVPLLTV